MILTDKDTEIQVHQERCDTLIKQIQVKQLNFSLNKNLFFSFFEDREEKCGVQMIAGRNGRQTYQDRQIQGVVYRYFGMQGRHTVRKKIAALKVKGKHFTSDYDDAEQSAPKIK